MRSAVCRFPLYDLIVTSTVNILMVKMADTPRGEAAVALWHDTVCRLAFLIFPLAALLVVGAHDLIVGLFTATYSDSVPIFIVWVLTMLPAVMAVDAVLRVYAQTRFLLIMNLVRFACVAGLIGMFLSSFGLMGAVLVALLGLTVTKTIGVIRVAWLMQLGVRDALPWRRLAGITSIAVSVHSPGSLAASHCRVASPGHVHRRCDSLRRDVPAALLYRLRMLRSFQVTRHKSQVTSHKPQFSEPGA